MNETYDSRDAAAYIAQQCVKKGFTYNNTKIQKLLYCAYGILLGGDGRILCDESPRRWPYGPVFPKVLHFIDNGGQISGYSTRIKESDDKEAKQAIELAVESFGQFPGIVLSKWSCKDDSPWSLSKNENNGDWNAIIPTEYIRNYFKEKVLDAKN